MTTRYAVRPTDPEAGFKIDVNPDCSIELVKLTTTNPLGTSGDLTVTATSSGNIVKATFLWTTFTATPVTGSAQGGSRPCWHSKLGEGWSTPPSSYFGVFDLGWGTFWVSAGLGAQNQPTCSWSAYNDSPWYLVASGEPSCTWKTTPGAVMEELGPINMVIAPGQEAVISNVVWS